MIAEFDPIYRVSSFCQNGECVEIASRSDGNIAVRDSKNSARNVLVYTPTEWREFIRGVKAGEFDL